MPADTSDRRGLIVGVKFWSLSDAISVVMQLARGAVEICRNQGKDMTEKYHHYAVLAPQWQWTFPQHYAAVA